MTRPASTIHMTQGFTNKWLLQSLQSSMFCPTRYQCLQAILDSCQTLFAVASAKLTAQGKPQIILADGSAYVLDLSLHTWLCVVDPAYAFTAFASLFPDALAKAGANSSISPISSPSLGLCLLYIPRSPQLHVINLSFILIFPLSMVQHVSPQADLALL